ncbi:hypothetical protein EOL96_03865 [Candidatus Saccharibacteria bacterium]|nr:hypothetical protein [Candidatus Saccharibacteria bacterium]
MGNPYVISAELGLTSANLEEVIKTEKIEVFRESLDTDLRAMGKATLWVPSHVIQKGLEQAIAKTSLPVVSLDNRYVTSATQYLGISRGVDTLLNDNSYVSRQGYPYIKEQLRRIPALGNEVLLVDDVLFSGGMVAWLADSLKPYGVKIGGVVVGIAIQEGIDKLASIGIEVDASEVFTEVEDEICERDFAVVPGSGRRIEALAANALYFDTKNGKPDKWASLPKEDTQLFCINSLIRSMNLLQRGVSMQTIGRFLGYGSSGEGINQLAKRLEECL